MNIKEVGYLLVRILVGMVLVIRAVTNILHLDSFIEESTTDFNEIGLLIPKWILEFMIVLPFVEVLLGILLFTGFLTRIILKTSHYTFMGVALFLIWVNKLDVAFLYVLMATAVFFLLVKIRYNNWSLDQRVS
ncbi:DoxX family membrane protein [Ascidiimonas sp. W6]|uniref:DoxX family membrane protein n=1 Tax=Ascidiimonas meishanensis TaxID=3128903 RepID=UPI0030EC3B4D